jgi:nucleotidyltransferase/DNA polymerase involved in DNA repair
MVLLENPRVIAHIDMDAFFAAIEQRDHPALLGRPVVVGADPKGGRGRGVVSTCSYEARRYGIHSAMPISMAYRRCPRAVFLPVDMRKYSAVSREVFQILNDFTPDVEPVSIDEAFLDITGSYHLFGSALDTCRTMKERIRTELRLSASVGIAPTKMVAKIASDYSKPDGLLEITPLKMFEFLWPLPVERMWGVGAETRKGLNKLGVKTIGDVANTPEALLCEHFGARGRHLHALARGVDEREVRRDDEMKSVSHEHTFETDTAEKRQIYDVLSVLSEKVSRRLRRHGLKGRTVTLKVRLKDFRTFTRDHTFPERTNFFEPIYKTSRMLFDAFHQEGFQYRLVGVRAAHFHDPYVRDGLFDDPKAEKMERMYKAIDTIKDKFGDGMIRRAQGS